MNPQNVLKIDLTPGHMLINLGMAMALAFVWATVYRKTHSGVAYSRSFFLALILVSPIVAMVMMAIGSNVALSLGLVGSLSVIRFRTVIKDTKDMVFLFFAVALGLCSGANAWMLAMIGTVMVSLVAVLIPQVSYTRAAASDYILVFRSTLKEPWTAMSEAAQNMVTWKQLRGATDADHGSVFEFTYNVRLGSKTSPEAVVNEISKNENVSRVTLIAPENHLDL